MFQTIAYRFGQTIMRKYAQMLLNMEVVQHARLPAGPRIFAANHPTTTDPFLLLALTAAPISILVTESCFKVPLFGHYLQTAGHIPVLQGDGRAAFDEARQLLNEGRTIGIFPEGVLSPLEGGLCQSVCRPHTGVARLALMTGAPVIPIGIGLQPKQVWFHELHIDGVTEMARWYFHGKYAITIGEPLYFEGDAENREQVRSVSDRVMDYINRLAHESMARVQAPQSLATHATLTTQHTVSPSLA